MAKFKERNRGLCLEKLRGSKQIAHLFREVKTKANISSYSSKQMEDDNGLPIFSSEEFIFSYWTSVYVFSFLLP